MSLSVSKIFIPKDDPMKFRIEGITGFCSQLTYIETL